MEKMKGVIYFTIGTGFTLVIGLIFAVASILLAGMNPVNREKRLNDEVVERMLVNDLREQAYAPSVQYVQTINPPTPIATPVQRSTGQTPAGYLTSGQVLIDNQYCTITFNELYNSDVWGATATFEIYNKTSDTLMFTINDNEMTINNHMINPIGVETIAGGKTGTLEVIFSESGLKNAGVYNINDITDMTVAFSAMNKEYHTILKTDVFSFHF